MKKILLITALICCMMPVMAQKSNDKTPEQKMKETKQKVELLNSRARSYVQKIDSAVADYGYKELYMYDQLFNCTKIYGYYSDGEDWELSDYSELEYDNLNRVTSITYIQPGYEDYAMRETIEYDDQGNTTAEIIWRKIEGEWVGIHKTTYEYNAQGDLYKENMYGVDDNGDWYLSNYWVHSYENGLQTEILGYGWSYVTGQIELDNRRVFGYNDQLLCTYEEYSLWDLDLLAWVLSNRTDYSYNADGQLVEEMFSRVYEYGGELEYSYKQQYEYDSHNNVTKMYEYRYENNWELEVTRTMEYDITVPAENIAGFSMTFVSNYYQDKLLKITDTNSYGEVEVTSLYYSAATAVNENVESLLNIWPNPASETLNLKGDMTQVQIYSIDGRLVMSLEKGFETINVSALSTGSYLLKATLKDGSVITQKFVKH